MIRRSASSSRVYLSSVPPQSPHSQHQHGPGLHNTGQGSSYHLSSVKQPQGGANIEQLIKDNIAEIGP